MTLITTLLAGAVVLACPPKSDDATIAKNGTSGCTGQNGAQEQVHMGAVADKAASAADIVDTAAAAGDFKTLSAALAAAGLVDALKGKGPFTVFAPSDKAFAELPEGTVVTLLKPENKDALIALLTFHVVPGTVTADQVATLSAADTLNGQRLAIATKDGRVTVDGATVVKTDIVATNGVIHVVDRVLMPVRESVVAVCREQGFSTLAAAIEAAGLDELLAGKGPFTVFAPTDAAFAALPKGTVESLLRPENKEKLRGILTYHVVPGRVFADKAKGLTSAKSAQGTPLSLRVADGKLMVDGATVTVADIEASNGVVHVIDTVVLPK